MKPLKNYVLVGEVAEEKVTESGIILTTSVNTGSKPGKVIAVGPDVSDVTVGVEVAVKWSEGMAVTVEGIQMVLVSEDHILAVY